MPKISNLPAAASAQSTDIVPAVQGGITKKETLAQILALYAGTIVISEAQVTGLVADLASKLALAGGTMSGAIAMGTNKITGLGTPTDVADAVTKAYADLKLALAGGTMTGAINMGGFGITNLLDPVANQDAATKNYVDQTALTGASVYAASAGSLGTVTQSGAGVGATLTNAGAQAVFALDGVNPPAGTNVLIKNTASGMTAANEGIFTVTDPGSISTNWVLTRASSYNTPSEINNTGLITVRNGSTLAGTQWYNSATIVTVDTTNFSYSQFGATFLSSTLASGKTFRGNVSNLAVASTSSWADTYAASVILYANGANNIEGLATANNAVLKTTTTGVPFMAVAGLQTSSSTGAFSTSSATYVDVTNATITITTTGRPVMLWLQGSGTSNAYLSATNSGIQSMAVVRDSTQLSDEVMVTSSVGVSFFASPKCFWYIDPAPAAGTYAYKLQTKSSANAVGVNNCVLMAMEL